MSEPDPRREALKARFLEERSWPFSGFWERMLEADPDYFEAYLNFRDVPWRKGVLAPKVKELIYIAMDVAATHLYEYGFRSHVRGALRQGATFEEILEVIEITSAIGIHSAVMGVPALYEELERAKAEGRAPAYSDGG